MFAWNTETTLAAVDAGVREVISAYNSAHCFIHRHDPKVNGFIAHQFAMAATITWLTQVELDRLAGAAVEAVLAA